MTAGRWPVLAAALAVLWLGACATPPPKLKLAAAGRLALQVAAHDEQPARGFNASFELWGDALMGELQLRSSLGTWLATASWAPGLARLASPDGERSHATMAELSQQAMGEVLPLEALPDWLAGRPGLGQPGTACEPAALACFQQFGWQVDHSRLADGLVVASRARAPSVTLRVKLDPPA